MLGALIVGSIAYTVWKSQAVIREEGSITPADSQNLDKRHKPGVHGYFDAMEGIRTRIFAAPPEKSCSAAAYPDALRGSALFVAGNEAAAITALERAVAKDRNCIGAIRPLVQLYARRGTHAADVQPFKTRAEDPGDAVAQLAMAYYDREAGNTEAFRKDLERASNAQRDLPLLDAAWADYWMAYANPTSPGEALKHDKQEIENTGDLSTAIVLARAYLQLGDMDQAVTWCDWFYEHEDPASNVGGVGLRCVEAAVRSGNPDAEKRMVERYWHGDSHGISTACMHADLSYVDTQACKLDDAVHEARTAIELGCVLPGTAQLRRAQAFGHHFEEAAAPPVGDMYWTNGDRYVRALALGALGRRSEALELMRDPQVRISEPKLVKWTANYDRYIALLEDDAPPEVVANALTCVEAPSEPRRLAMTASGYLNAGMLDEVEPRLKKALELEPKNPAIMSSWLFYLSTVGRLEEAKATGERAIAEGVEDGWVLNDLGYTYAQLHDCPRAVPLFERARRLLPLDEPVYVNEAKCLDAMGRTDEAEKLWRYVSGSPPRARWWLIALLAVGTIALYLGGKLALIKLAPARFGNLKFP
ncbi:MAG: hypothetical protein JST54_35760 [Deltaproteobacteria bacterium]|nr:hypothetical protein [Deltaproteobacteria bacterium]